jgi:hypothetical protein
MSDFNITLNMNQPSVDYITQQKYYLYCIKFPSINFRASPLIWFTDNSFLRSTRLQWNKAYEAFISTQLIYTSGTLIIAYSSKARVGEIPSVSSEYINLGQKMAFGEDGLLTIQKGQPAQIEIVSATKNPRYSFGVNQSLDSLSPTPLFIAQISSDESKTTMPLTEYVLLTFSQRYPPLQVSTVIDTAFAPGILVSMSETETNREMGADGSRMDNTNSQWRRSDDDLSYHELSKM